MLSIVAEFYESPIDKMINTINNLSIQRYEKQLCA